MAASSPLLLAGLLTFAASAGVHPGASFPEASGDDLELRVNLPSYELEVLVGAEVLRTYDVTIGKPSHFTPPGDYTITRIEWNPWWHPPDSDWAAGESPAAPGPDNPMGRAKIQFDDLLYIHGTEALDHIGRPASHGCIRITNDEVLELARIVISHGREGFDLDELDAIEADPSDTRGVWLEEPVSLDIRYEIASPLPGDAPLVRLHPDVYGLEQRPPSELARSLLPGDASLDEAALDAWKAGWSKAQRTGEPVEVSLESLGGGS